MAVDRGDRRQIHPVWWRLQATARHAAMALIACLLIAGSWGCQGSPSPSRPVCNECEGGDWFVRLHRHSLSKPPASLSALSHPFRLDAEGWRVILASIHVQRHPGGFLEPAQRNPVVEAFTSAELDYLAATLSQVFSIAQPHEWVVFNLTRTGSASLKEYTTGAWYVRANDIHLILANYRSAVSLPGIRTLLHRDPLHSNGRSVYDVIPREHQRKDEHGDDLPSIMESAGQELVIDYVAALGKGYEPGLAVPEGSSPRTHSIEERLQTLKRLLDRGLITEEDYEHKKRQLLEQL